MAVIPGISLDNTFDQWRIVTNQLVVIANEIEANGNLYRAVSNTSSIIPTANIGRGGIVYFDLNLTQSYDNTSTNIIASANTVNLVHRFVVTTYSASNVVFNFTNSAYITANAGFTRVKIGRAHV